MAEKNKGGRPSNAELAARGMTKTEFAQGLQILKRVFGKSIDRMIEISDNPDIPLKDQFRMKKELADMYVALVKSDHTLRIQLSREGDAPSEPDEDVPTGPVLAFSFKR